MKMIVLTGLFCLLGWSGMAQSMPARIYIVRNGTPTLGALRFYTTLSADQAIKVKNNGYTLLETDADSIGIVKESRYSDIDYQSSGRRQKTTFIQVERGKSYYFKVGFLPQGQLVDVEEMTERAFQLYIGLNELGDNPIKYVLSKSAGLVQRAQ